MQFGTLDNESGACDLLPGQTNSQKSGKHGTKMVYKNIYIKLNIDIDPS